ncbi:MAG: cyclopropane fatty acyl phospholipid synthase [Thiohalocapsa sp.]|nr:cyclopropane fatty acyl phospholipid synthase [Thiohalocapsa sp.]
MVTDTHAAAKIEEGQFAAQTPRAKRQAPRILAQLIEPADVRLDSDARPWDIRVLDDSLYDRVIRDGSLGLGEAYMDGAWDSEQLDETFTRLLRADLDQALHGVARLRFALAWLQEHLLNRQSKARAFRVGEQHYDIGNDVYEAMLDPGMSYSCGYWADARDLDQAQQAKLALTCRKLDLTPGQRLIDIGCGWGSISRYAAEHHGVDVLGITVSREQQRLAQQRCAGLPVEIRLCDYRDLEDGHSGEADRIVSIGMFEHVGVKNYGEYFRVASRLLRDDGLFLLHTIGNTRTVPTSDAWIDKYIFPNGKIPSAREITAAIEPYFVLEDWHNFGLDYDRTLMAWWHNFDRAWPMLRGRYDERFYRMWKYYLHCTAAFFRARQGQLWQLVLSKRPRNRPYRSVR